MQCVFKRAGREIILTKAAVPSDATALGPEAPFPCMLWDATAGWSVEQRSAVIESLLDAGCRYAVCGGRDAEVWHDLFDEIYIDRETKGLDTDAEFVMTSWHADEAAREVADFLLGCTEFDEHRFRRFHVLQLGGDERASQELVAALVAAGEEMAREDWEAESAEDAV